MAALPLPVLTLVVPAFNEAGRIGETVRRVTDYLDHQSYTWELIVVIDGGADLAGDEARRAAGVRPNVRVLETEVNRGKGYSVRRGFSEARGDRLVFIDADLSLPIEGLASMMERFDAGADVVIGSRAIPGASELGTPPALRLRMSRIFNGVVQLLALPGLSDTQCGFKGFTARVATTIFASQTIDRFGFDVEVLFLARKHGYRIDELPVTCTYHSGSSVGRIGDVLNMLYDVCLVRWRHR